MRSAQVAPLPWGHITLTGDYLWNEIDQPLERFRPIRANRFNPKSFVFPYVHGCRKPLGTPNRMRKNPLPGSVSI